MKTFIQALVLSLTATFAYAHTQLSSSTPADEAVVHTSPEAITLKFSEPVRLMSLSLEGATGKHDLRPLPSSASAEFSIEAPSLADGRYVVAWRAMSADTHVVTGQFGFAVNSAHGASHAGH
jgi:copper transport protein